MRVHAKDPGAHLLIIRDAQGNVLQRVVMADDDEGWILQAEDDGNGKLLIDRDTGEIRYRKVFLDGGITIEKRDTSLATDAQVRYPFQSRRGD